ncbi:hypothetical protein NW768_007362 [Fusarium equiseti]|uniref:Peptidase M20 dimerisation domain-containing protein n=1 Tax=Fusarium equiseti TaxID=61235 RepID=A0ABQ8R7H7_FUSEQ|nr:hypothetical protein NW768_007362 [Fusarium equiseti]
MKLAISDSLRSIAPFAFRRNGGKTPATDPVSSSRVLKLHGSLVEHHPSTTGSKKPVTDYLRTYLKNAGFTVETQPVAEGRENIFAYYKTRKTRVLMMSSVVPRVRYWQHKRRGDEIWGRESLDVMSINAALIVSVMEMHEKKEIGESDVALLFVVDKEPRDGRMRAAKTLGLSWESIIFCAPTELKLATGHKGTFTFKIKAKGKEGCSAFPETGTNAIDSLARGLVALQQAELPSSTEFGKTTIHIAHIEGGGWSVDIPANASAFGIVWFAAGTADEMKDIIKKVVDESDPHLSVEFSTFADDPLSLDHDVEGFEKAVVSYGTGISLIEGDHKKYLYGPGSLHEPHSDHEHLVSELEGAVEGYKALISHALQKPKGF